MANPCLPSIAGKLRHSIAIQTITLGAQDAFGGYSETWNAGTNVRAMIKQLKGSERILGAQNTYVATYRFTIRYNSFPTLTAQNRISYDGRLFEIHRINNVDERNYIWEIDATEGAGT